MNDKKIILKKSFNGLINNLLIGSHTDIVKDSDGNTLTDILKKFATNNDLNELKDRFNSLVENAPELYNTLREISDWIEDHQDIYINLMNSLSNKVDKVEGKGLSTNDFTNELNGKLTNDYSKEGIDTIVSALESRIDSSSLYSRQIQPNTSVNDYINEGFYYYIPEDDNFKYSSELSCITNGTKLPITNNYTNEYWNTIDTSYHTLFDNKTTIYLKPPLGSYTKPMAFSFYGLITILKYNGIMYFALFDIDKFINLKKTYEANKDISIYLNSMSTNYMLVNAGHMDNLGGGRYAWKRPNNDYSKVLIGLVSDATQNVVNISYNNNIYIPSVSPLISEYIDFINYGITGNIVELNLDSNNDLIYSVYDSNGEYCYLNELIDTISNKPTLYPFFMITGRHDGYFQIAFESKLRDANIYYRNYNGTSWGYWETLGSVGTGSSLDTTAVNALILGYLSTTNITTLNNSTVINSINNKENKIHILTPSQYNELIENGTVVVGDESILYNSNDYYLVKDETNLENHIIGYINQVEDYSLEETVIGKWIDDKPLYQKTICIDLTALPVQNGNGWKYKRYTIEGLYIDNCITMLYSAIRTTESGDTIILTDYFTDQYGYGFYNETLKFTFDIAKFYGEGGICTIDIIDTTNGSTSSTILMSQMSKLYITIKYTKTTDGALSENESSFVSYLNNLTFNDLTTTNKLLVPAINEVFQSVSSGKQLVASAITDKGVPTEEDATFQVMANNIKDISTGNTSNIATNNFKSSISYFTTSYSQEKISP